LRADTVLDLLEGVEVGASPVHRPGVIELTIPWSRLARGRAAAMSPSLDSTARSVAPTDSARLDSVAARATEAVDEQASLTGFGPVEAPIARELAVSMAGRQRHLLALSHH
jgi:hypothetical protein